MVFDAEVKVPGQSLNSNISCGPDHVNSLVGVFIRFHKHKITVTADIEGTFHPQVNLKPPDTDAVRFLWKLNPSSTDPPDHYQVLVYIFGATDSPCCAAYTQKSLRSEGKFYSLNYRCDYERFLH